MMNSQGSSLTLLGILFAQLFSLVQTMGVLSTINIEWTDPLKSLLKAMSLVAFDIDIIHPNCLMDSDPVIKFLIRIIIILGALIFLVVLHLIVVVSLHKGEFRNQMPYLIASIGTVLFCFFLSVVTSALSAVHCNEHPNGLQTLWAYPSLLCWEGGKHDSLVVLSAFALLIPASFLAAALWALWVFPQRVRNADMYYFKCWGYLFFRFKPQTYYYGVLVLLRNAIVACSPLFHEVVVQVFVSLLTLLGNFAIALYVKPWVHYAATLFDVMLLFSMIMFCVIGLAFLQNTEPDGLSNFAFAMLMTVIGCGFAMGMQAAFRWYIRKTTKPFQFFLSHYKEEMGAFCRHLKTVLSKTSVK
jgi:preprotein translocase subunit SecG